MKTARFAVVLALSLAAAIPAQAEPVVPPEAGVAAPGPGFTFILTAGNKLVLWGETLELSENDAFLKSGGFCAFNLGYLVQSYSGATDITNTISEGERLVARNTHITVAAGGRQYVQTQPYLKPGLNKLSLLVNAEGGNSDAKTAYVKVAGTCGKDAAATQTTVPASGDTTATTPPRPATDTGSTTAPASPTTTTAPAATAPTATATTPAAGDCVGTIGADLTLKAPCLRYAGPFGSETFWVELERVENGGSREILYRLKSYGLVK